MLTSAFITPHPPLLIPGISEEEERKKVRTTSEALKLMAVKLEEEKPDTLLIISPHAPWDRLSFLLNRTPELRGGFSAFGLAWNYEAKNDLGLLDLLAEELTAEQIPFSWQESELDHGTLVPLYFLTRKIKPAINVLSFSSLNLTTHYRYGEIIGKVLEKTEKKVAVIASGDLSHRLTKDAPAGYSSQGKIFDQKIIKYLKEGTPRSIIELPPELAEEAGECGWRSIAILLGILRGENSRFDILSYEAPFGVGYLTAIYQKQ